MSHFHFSPRAPDEQLSTDIENLKQLTVDQAGACFDLIMGILAQQSADMNEDIARFAGSSGLSPVLVRGIVSGSLYFFKEALRVNLPPAHLKEDLLNFGVPEEIADIAIQKWKSNFVSMSRSIYGQTLTINNLVDLKWRFGVTTANSQRDKVGSTFMQVKLVLDKGNDVKENVHMEMDLRQFYEFVQQLEQAKAYLDYYS
ncbi:COMM domain containing 7 [Pelomyxa schiedti]|nr:COMM domain containing 7 [Pelomyxa schiedti]